MAARTEVEIPAEDPGNVEVPVIAPVADDRISSKDEAAFKGKGKRMAEILRAQPKRTIRISKELWGHETFVAINGYPFVIKNGERVEVPQQVAELLEEAGRI